MTPKVQEFAQLAGSLGERLGSLALKLDQAARELQESGTPPAEALVNELTKARTEFNDLRTRVLNAARAASVAAPPAAEIDSLAKLEPLMHAVVEAIVAAERQQALAAARGRALGVLDRVLGMTHSDDPKFGPLLECQDRTKEMRERVLAADAPEAVAEGTSEFAALLMLVENREQLDDDRFATLQDGVAQSFGRPLAVAATRGKLNLAAAPATPRPPAPPPKPVEEAPRPAAPPPTPVEEAPRPAAPPPTPVEEAPRPPAPPPKPVEEAPRPVAPPPPAPVLPAAVLGATTAKSSPVGAEAVVQAVQDEAAQWWVSAWARWTSWRSTLSFGDAVKQELSKYSYLLSVPIHKSADYEDGLLSYGYSIILEYVERQNPGFVANALNGLKTLTPEPGKSVGGHLYDFLVTAGRLPALYPEFVKQVLVAAVPDPGVWTTARILESTMETRVFTHPTARVGDPEHNSQRLTQDRQRFADHRFQFSLAPLTTRFFAVAADLRDSRTVEVRLQENRAGSDQAWLLSMPPVGRADLRSDLVRIAPEGTSLAGLGKEFATLWVAAFNTDPNADKRYELTLGLRKESGKAAAATFRSARS